MLPIRLTGLWLAATSIGLGQVAASQGAAAQEPVIGRTFAESSVGAIVRPVAPAGAPNVLVWMIDDVGFGQLGSYGGLVETPNTDRLAARGLRFTNYHATPVCSASRAAFLTGRNAHRVHVGGHSAIAIGFPGQDALVPRAAGTIAANLQASGYATYALGKWDHLPQADASQAGPFTYWPSGQGFDQYYGFLAFDADNFRPTLWADHQPVVLPDRADYHLSADMADKAIAWIRSRDATEQRRPFLMYWATGAAHSPHHAPQRWLEHYRGRFAEGWDAAAQRILDRQKRAGLVPAHMAVPPRPEGVQSWHELSAEQQRLYARQMEAFAAQLSHADEQFGRILDDLEARGELDNTIVIVTSDNGASAEGAPGGTFSELYFTNAYTADEQQNLAHFGDWGGPSTYPHYAVGWAYAGNTPFRFFKQTAYEGGTRVPLIVAWPRGISGRGELRDQYHHVTDLAPTILDSAGIAPVLTIGGERQIPFDGVSMAKAFADPDAPDRRGPQYYEMYANRAIYADGWKAVVPHRLKVWDFMSRPAVGDDNWELYDLRADPGETRNLARSRSGKLEEMKRLFDREARANNVYPLTNTGDAWGVVQQLQAHDRARRNDTWTYPGPVARIPEALAPPFPSMSFSIEAVLDVAHDADGTIAAIGGRHGGFSLYLRQGRPIFAYRSMDLQFREFASTRELRAGEAVVRLSFERRSDSEAEVSMMVDDQRVAGGTIRGALPRLSFSPSETFDIGSDTGTSALGDGPGPGPLQGDIKRVSIRVAPVSQRR